ncbi:hypothetical protein NHQ30_011368 [Ciborinia camelliae]|nr:hypothetical protein NHQ30_011368 [Ciborinia camelliae]
MMRDGKMRILLEMQIERQKTQYKLEGRVWGDAAGPSDRLRALREEMDDVDRGPGGGRRRTDGSLPSDQQITRSVAKIFEHKPQISTFLVHPSE